ncbi:hypothetical protein PanWU01x14_072130 [Parasponia andersonii]|uniref:Uncharacterized protein n=1 Tax=Parasponia andersonii TaxID=3476 RepID=A0A2P5DDP0_PARAD|nr:hypothetical protein PanWU01x14_072130 [Parasponia andersonii]
MTSVISGRPCTALAALSLISSSLSDFVKDREFGRKAEWNLVGLEERRWTPCIC